MLKNTRKLGNFAADRKMPLSQAAETAIYLLSRLRPNQNKHLEVA